MSATMWVAIVILACCCAVLGWVLGRLSAKEHMINAVFSPHIPRPGDPNYWARAHQYDLMWSGFEPNSKPVSAYFDEYVRHETGGAA